MPVELYLQGYGDYEADVDYVDDHIEERHLGTRDHSKWRQAVQYWFLMHAHEWNTIGLPELRIRIGPRRYRISDVAILDRDAPDEQVPSRPPLAIFEVLSPEDRRHHGRVRLADYAAMGARRSGSLTGDRQLLSLYRRTARIENRVQLVQTAESPSLLTR